MKKRMFACFLIFPMCLLHLSIPDPVLGQQGPADKVFGKYRTTLFEHPDVHDFFPHVLNALKAADIQKILISSVVINNFANEPRFVKDLVPDVDNSIVVLLTVDDTFQALFRDKQFHTVLQNPTEIDKLVALMANTTPRSRDAVCQLPPQPTPEPRRATTLEKVSEKDLSGEVGETLEPFVVGVLDQDGKPLQGIVVTFAITPPGNGRLSVISQTTDVYGQARTTLTLGSRAGTYSVTARAEGIPETQMFTATATPPPLPPDPEPEPDPEPVVSMPPSTPKPSLPRMYWIEGNTIYHRPTGGQKTLFNTPQHGTLMGGLAVDTVGQKVYWTEEKKGDGTGWKDSHNHGRVRSANLNDLDGKTVETVREIFAVPLDIAVGTDKSDRRWVYWTNSSKRIQRIKVDRFGNSIETSFDGDFMEFPSALTPPNHIAFDQKSFRLYWTEQGRIRGVAANGTGKRDTIVEGLGELGGIAVADGTVYWTEQTDTGPGTLQGAVKSMNENSSHRKLLAGLESIPQGIAVDAVGGKVYWTTSRGYIQSVPLGGVIEPVVEGNNTRAVGLAVVSSSMDKMGAVPSAAAPSISPVVSVENTLLANYPNPFNPETWIPYQLSESADVSVSIYSVNGHLVRRLELGHQSAGVYRSRSRAAYWDGRNAFGERVASGLYFYTLTAGDFTATRKMLIRK